MKGVSLGMLKRVQHGVIAKILALKLVKSMKII